MRTPCVHTIELNRYLAEQERKDAIDRAIEDLIAETIEEGEEFYPLEPINYLSALNDISQAELCETETGELAATAALLREGKHEEYCNVISRLLKTYWIKEAAKMADDFYH